MKPYRVALLLILLTAGSGTAQQYTRRTARSLDTGPVTVMRGANLQVIIASDMDSVFSYLSDQGKITAWLSDQAILEPQFGGKYHFRWKSMEPVDGVVTEYKPTNALAYSWKHPSDEGETQVRFKLSPQSGRTLVEQDLRGFTSADAVDKAVTFWVFYLQNLKSVVEDQIDLRAVIPKTHARPPGRQHAQ